MFLRYFQLSVNFSVNFHSQSLNFVHFKRFTDNNIVEGNSDVSNIRKKTTVFYMHGPGKIDLRETFMMQILLQSHIPAVESRTYRM